MRKDADSKKFRFDDESDGIDFSHNEGIKTKEEIKKSLDKKEALTMEEIFYDSDASEYGKLDEILNKALDYIKPKK